MQLGNVVCLRKQKGYLSEGLTRIIHIQPGHYHSCTAQRSGLLSGYVDSNFTVPMLDNHLINVHSASVPGLVLLSA